MRARNSDERGHAQRRFARRMLLGHVWSHRLRCGRASPLVEGFTRLHARGSGPCALRRGRCRVAGLFHRTGGWPGVVARRVVACLESEDGVKGNLAPHEVAQDETTHRHLGHSGVGWSSGCSWRAGTVQGGRGSWRRLRGREGGGDAVRGERDRISHEAEARVHARLCLVERAEGYADAALARGQARLEVHRLGRKVRVALHHALPLPHCGTRLLAECAREPIDHILILTEGTLQAQRLGEGRVLAAAHAAALVAPRPPPRPRLAVRARAFRLGSVVRLLRELGRIRGPPRVRLGGARLLGRGRESAIAHAEAGRERVGP
mmetsp:Transcript_24138/g.75234  ORF Transcript_24138/g.75234 Transcript_24138/m.75234 type:complete len:320 (-) Transcript_24138:102-1061(-)